MTRLDPSTTRAASAPSTTAPAIETKQLTKTYANGFVALSDLSLTIEEGEIFGFLGHNGAGKTTTVHLLTTLLRPSSGAARIFGTSIVEDPLAVRRLIGYVPENVRLYDAMTARDNLAFFGTLSGVDDLSTRIGETLEFLEASELADRAVGTFSKGQRQRIGLAQAILHRPRVLFLDEPSSGLDPLGIRNLRDLIARINAEHGTTIFMNTHLISEIAKTCHAIGVLNRGRLVFHDRAEVATRKYATEEAIEELYLSLTPQSTREEAA